MHARAFATTFLADNPPNDAIVPEYPELLERFRAVLACEFALLLVRNAGLYRLFQRIEMNLISHCAFPIASFLSFLV